MRVIHPNDAKWCRRLGGECDCTALECREHGRPFPVLVGPHKPVPAATSSARLRIDPDNAITLCQEHHIARHRKGVMP